MELTSRSAILDLDLLAGHTRCHKSGYIGFSPTHHYHVSNPGTSARTRVHRLRRTMLPIKTYSSTPQQRYPDAIIASQLSNCSQQKLWCLIPRHPPSDSQQHRAGLLLCWISLYRSGLSITAIKLSASLHHYTSRA